MPDLVPQIEGHVGKFAPVEPRERMLGSSPDRVGQRDRKPQPESLPSIRRAPRDPQRRREPKLDRHSRLLPAKRLVDVHVSDDERPAKLDDEHGGHKHPRRAAESTANRRAHDEAHGHGRDNDRINGARSDESSG